MTSEVMSALKLVAHGTEEWIRQLRVSSDGRYLATTSQNGTGRVTRIDVEPQATT